MTEVGYSYWISLMGSSLLNNECGNGRLNEFFEMSLGNTWLEKKIAVFLLTHDALVQEY